MDAKITNSNENKANPVNYSTQGFTGDPKIQLELAPPTEKECKEEEKNTDNVEVVANADIRNKHQHFSKVKI